MNGLRRVEFFKYKFATGTESELIKAGEGFFHCWGLNLEELETTVASETVAIIEKDDGEVVVAAPDMTRFLEPPPKPEPGVTTIENVSGPLNIKL